MVQKLSGHTNVVYAISFNLPYGDKVATGSFDTTAKLWSTETGKCLSTYRGHSMEIVCLAFDPMSTQLLTGSMDKKAKLWNLETDQELFELEHEGEIISVSFNMDGDKILTGSFDKTVKIWDAYNGSLIAHPNEHTGEVSTCQHN